VEDGLFTGHDPLHKRGISDVSALYVDSRANVFAQVVEPPIVTK
jgi:hypothetical protein